ncbi:MAG TPA: hypothetical protein PKM88_03040 [bacterium]|nr:hypothetical protein [bacterium]
MTDNESIRFNYGPLKATDIAAADAVLPAGARAETGGQPRRQLPESAPPDELAGAHFAELARAVEQAHRRLVAAGSRYRFCVYRAGDEVFIDLVVLGTDGRIFSSRQKNITREQFTQWLENIDKGEGMFFDHCG